MANHARVFESTMESLGLTPRPQQAKLVELIRQVVGAHTPDPRFVQAGTGVGKSFAALTTAVEAHRSQETEEGVAPMPALVICPTNRLIDQYVQKDAPRVAKATGARIEYLKGRRNYVCAESYGMETKFGRAAMAEFTRMMETGRFEWAQHNGLDESFGCDGNCDNDVSVCGVQWARERAKGAAVIVTNGHMLVFDRLIQEWSDFQARLLPEFCALIIDECHEWEAVLRGCLSDEIGPKSSVYEKVPGLNRWVMSQITEAALSDRNREVAVDTTDPELQQMVEIATKALYKINREMDGTDALADKDILKGLRKEAKALGRFLSFAAEPDEDSSFISAISVEPDSTWPGGLKPKLQRLCVDASRTGRDILSGQASVLISGTVPPSLPKRLGVARSGNGNLHDVGTPFDYSRSVLAISSYSPKNRDHDLPRLRELLGAVKDMCGRSHADGGGGTLVLVTSWADLDTVAAFLAQNLPHTTPVLCQAKGDAADTAEMLELFADHGHAVLVGVRSLWTGVDIPGPALRQVAIWKLPYGVPTIEVRAISDRLGRQVYNDEWMQLFAQGAGRLVRTVEDDGRVLVCDSRAKSISWASNPMTTHIADFTKFSRA